VNGKFGNLIEQARKQGSQKGEENQIADKPDNQIIVDPDVNLCTKVPLSLRRHWSAEAKRKGVTLTAVITTALTEAFGTPD